MVLSNTTKSKNSCKQKEKLKSEDQDIRGEQTLREHSSVFETELEAVNERYRESVTEKIPAKQTIPSIVLTQE